MALSRKHFERIAKIIKGQKCEVRKKLNKEFSDYFKEENPYFDAEKFKKASGGDC